MGFFFYDGTQWKTLTFNGKSDNNIGEEQDMDQTAGLTFLGLTAGNYIWQVLKGKNWILAAERSFFQGVALIAYLITSAN